MLQVQIRSAATAAWGAPLDWCVSGAPPEADVELRISIVDMAGIRWTSLARYRSGRDGVVTLDSPLVEASWTGYDPEGWWWSMRPEGWAGSDEDWLVSALTDPAMPTVPLLEPLAPVTIDIMAQCQTQSAVAQLIRARLPEEIAVESPEGIAGQAFLPARPRAALLLIGGSEGGVQALRAAQLAGAGVAVLAQAWHQWPGTSNTPSRIPIEAFRRGLQWLRHRTAIEQPAVWGASRGSEAAVLLANAEGGGVGQLICWVPTHIAHAGLAPAVRDFRLERLAMWTLEGQDVDPVRWADLDATSEAQRAIALRTLPGWRAAADYARLWSRPDADRHHLPTSAIRAPTLLVSGADDGLWPSAMGAERLAKALRSQVPVTSHCYTSVGHTIPVPGDPLPFVRTRLWRGMYGVDAGFIDVGGAPAATAAAARHSQALLVDFLLG